MGKAHSTGRIIYHTQSEIHIDEKSLSFVRTKTDPRFGEIDEFQHNESKEKIFRKDVIIDDPTLLTESNLQGLKNRVNQRHTNLLQVYGFIIETEELESKEITKISFYFEHFATDASVEFRARKKSQNYFQEEELLGSLLYTLHVLHFLQEKDINHGNMMPSSILMGSDGEIKLADHSLLNKDHSLYRQILKGIQTPYIAPELLQLIKNKEEPSSSKYNPYKADVFSLGMTFLYAALLTEPLECYEWESLSFNGAHLYDLFEKVRDKYPGPFANILHSLIKIDPKERPDFLDLVENIEYHKNNDFYVRDPRYAHPAPKIVVSGADFVSKHLRSPRAQGRGTPYEKGTDYYTPIKRDVSPQPASYAYNTREQPLDQSRIEIKTTNIPALRPLPQTTQSALVYNFVDPKVQAIIRESREKTAMKSQLASPYSTKTLEYASTIKPTYHVQPNSADTRFASSTYNPVVNTSLTINPSGPVRYQSALGLSGIHSPSSLSQEHHQSFDQFNPRFHNPFVEANPITHKSFESPVHQHQETEKIIQATKELLKKQQNPYEDHSRPYSYGFLGAKPSELDTTKRSDIFTDDQFYLKYGIQAPKTTANVVGQTTENVAGKPDDKLTFNSNKVNELIAQIKAGNYSPGSSLEQNYPGSIGITNYDKSNLMPGTTAFSPSVHQPSAVYQTSPGYQPSSVHQLSSVHQFSAGQQQPSAVHQTLPGYHQPSAVQHPGIQSTVIENKEGKESPDQILAELKRKYLEEEKNLQTRGIGKSEPEYKAETEHRVQQELKPEKEVRLGGEIKTDFEKAKSEDAKPVPEGIVKAVLKNVVFDEKPKPQEKPVTPNNEKTATPNKSEKAADSATDDIVRELRQKYGRSAAK